MLFSEIRNACKSFINICFKNGTCNLSNKPITEEGKENKKGVNELSISNERTERSTIVENGAPSVKNNSNKKSFDFSKYSFLFDDENEYSNKYKYSKTNRNQS